MFLINSTLEQFCFEDGHYYTHSGTDEEPVFMQYTGLKDAKGREIYEGDVIRYGSFKRKVVEWSKKQFKNGWNFGAGDYGMHWEVIGNIYENPELLSTNTERK